MLVPVGLVDGERADLRRVSRDLASLSWSPLRRRLLRAARGHELPPNFLGSSDLNGQSLRYSKQCRPMIISDTGQAETHQLGRLGQGQRLMERLFQITGQFEG